MDDCIEAQWELYIGSMRKTLDYNITIKPLTIIPLTVKCTHFSSFTIRLQNESLCILIHHSPLRCVRFIDQKKLIWIFAVVQQLVANT
jgi:hypothetical protein